MIEAEQTERMWSWLEDATSQCMGRLGRLFLISMGILLFAVLGMFAAFKGMGLAFCTVEGESMMPTVTDGTRLLLNPGAEIERFDIAVFKTGGRYFIKRVIGLPGDTVEVSGGELYVNGEFYGEPYLSMDNCRQFGEKDFTVSVPEGEYFLLGDNRDDSLDSRRAGTFPKRAFVGIPVMAMPS